MCVIPSNEKMCVCRAQMCNCGTQLLMNSNLITLSKTQDTKSDLPSNEKVVVLSVDDDPINQLVIQNLLVPEGFEVSLIISCAPVIVVCASVDISTARGARHAQRNGHIRYHEHAY